VGYRVRSFIRGAVDANRFRYERNGVRKTRTKAQRSCFVTETAILSDSPDSILCFFKSASAASILIGNRSRSASIFRVRNFVIGYRELLSAITLVDG
jgi:hypothetical protein